MSLSDKRIGGNYDLLYPLQALSQFEVDVSAIHRQPEYTPGPARVRANGEFHWSGPEARWDERSKHIRQSLQCPEQFFGSREHQPGEQWRFCRRRTVRCRVYDSNLQRAGNRPEGRLKRQHTITDAIQL